MSINLLSAQKRRVRAEKVFFAKLQAGALVLLVAYSAVLFGAMGTKAWHQGQVETLSEEIDGHKRAIEALYPVEAKQTLLANKIELLREYFDQFVGMRETLVGIFEDMPEQVEVSGVEFGELSRESEFAMQSEDVFVMTEWLSYMESVVTGQRVAGVNVAGVSRGDAATYQAQQTVEVSGGEE